MPEGPEVLTIVDQLDFYLNSKVLSSIEFTSGRYEDNGPEYFDEFVDDLPLTIERVFCKGKLIVFQLSSVKSTNITNITKKWWIFNSLRMTGTWSLNKNINYGRLEMNFLPRIENGVFDIDKIFYVDVRSLGTFEFIKDEDEVNKRLSDLANGFIGIEEYTIDYETFYTNIKKCKNSYLTSKLTDQRSICSGIGNYLLSEILYDSEIYPFIKCSELDDEVIKRLFDSCNTLINLSYSLGGMSMRDYVDITGTSGGFHKHLKVYGKRKETDPYGNRVVHSKRSNGQTIWYVPGLQRIKKIKKQVVIVFED